MKRAFGLSKDVDIVDVTNLLKEFEKGNFFHAQSLGAVTQELQEALLKDPALMYKLLPEKAKSFIKQFDNIKGFKNKLLEAYFKDKAEYDESFKDGVAEVTRAAGLTKLIKAAVALSVNSDQKDTIVAALDRNFSDYAKGLQITIVEAFETNIGNLPENMAAYREDNPVINLPPKKLVSNLLVAGQPEVAGLPVVAGQLEAGQQVAGQLVDNIGV